MKSKQVLLNNELTPNEMDVCFIGDLVGSCSKEFGKYGLYKAISLYIEDNSIDSENDFESCILSKDVLIEIALSCDILYTNFGFDVHSHTMKTDKTLKHLIIKK